jgi:hypothetical protein
MSDIRVSFPSPSLYQCPKIAASKKPKTNDFNFLHRPSFISKPTAAKSKRQMETFFFWLIHKLIKQTLFINFFVYFFCVLEKLKRNTIFFCFFEKYIVLKQEQTEFSKFHYRKRVECNHFSVWSCQSCPNFRM